MDLFTLADGRRLSYREYGDPNGKPVIFSHGFSDSSLIQNADESLVANLSLRVIAADQPGVGESSPSPKRRMVDWGKDMEELADGLGIGTFVSAGHSGGGPHALSIAYRLPERVSKVVLASPVLPLDHKGATKLLRNKDLKNIVRLRRLSFVLKLAYKYGAKSTLKDIPKFMTKTAEDDPSDAGTYLDDPAQRAMFERSFTAGLAQNGEGMFEMTMALWNWGFDPAEVRQPTVVFYGDKDDILDPEMPKQLAELLPNATTRLWPGAGHYGFVDRERWLEFFGEAAA